MDIFMRIISYIFLTIIVVLGFTFACLNAEAVNINYYIGSTTMALSMLLVMTVVIGMIIGFLVSLGWIFKLKRKVYHCRHQVKQLEQELIHSKNVGELGE